MDPFESPQERVESIFQRMDSNADGRVDMKEFLRCCLDDQKHSSKTEPPKNN
jgi:Ca2+-binding EF-hand superfamily protein